MSGQDARPAMAHRLFGHYGDFDHLIAQTPDFVIGRVLEDGSGKDLVWLTSVFSETQIAAWHQLRGPRQLSRRSRLFWDVVLNHHTDNPPKINIELWPL